MVRRSTSGLLRVRRAAGGLSRLKSGRCTTSLRARGAAAAGHVEQVSGASAAAAASPNRQTRSAPSLASRPVLTCCRYPHWCPQVEAQCSAACACVLHMRARRCCASAERLPPRASSGRFRRRRYRRRRYGRRRPRGSGSAPRRRALARRRPALTLSGAALGGASRRRRSRHTTAVRARGAQRSRFGAPYAPGPVLRLSAVRRFAR